MQHNNLPTQQRMKPNGSRNRKLEVNRLSRRFAAGYSFSRSLPQNPEKLKTDG
jgi:hypothetical protein